MMVTPHLLAGAAVAKLARRPALAWPLALASHFVLDAIPHVHPASLFDGAETGLTDTAIVAGLLDVSLGVLLVAVLALPRHDRKLLLGGALCGFLPDLIDALPGIGPWLRTSPGTSVIGAGHHGLQHLLPPPPVWLGISTQIIVSVIAIWVVRHHWRPSGRQWKGKGHSARNRGWQV